ncbi:MAG: glycosyltransferase family 39 protein [Ignavibacteriaceae bacterium]
MKKLKSDFLIKNKYLFLIAGLNFFLIYLSSFVKGYGYFIDEFYYIACAFHPALGYVDHPPLAPLVLSVFQYVFGDSLYAVRILPALAASASVFSAGILTKEIGGGIFAQCLAACTMAATPVIVAFGGFYSMNAFEPLLAIILLIFTVKMIKENNPGRWIILGIFMGLGLMNKHTFAVFIIVLVFSLLISGKWRLVINKWFAFGSSIALLIFLPNIIWQILNDYPSIEFYKNVTAYKNVYTPPLAFFLNQLLQMSPATFPIWFAGLIFLIFSKKTNNFRFLLVLFISLFIIMMYSGTSRPDRLVFAYPAVFAGGALFFESFIIKHNLKWFKGVLIAFLYLGLAITIPVILPYFNYDTVGTYTQLLGLNTEVETGNKPPLPQLIADRIGWEEKFDLVLKAYNSLPDEEKKETIIAAGNYGQAGAIELFGKNYNLPSVVCGHNNYYLWSKSRLHGHVVLQLTNDKNIEKMKKRFEYVTLYPGEYKNPYVTSHENNLIVFICKNPKMQYSEMLDKGKFYY